MSLKEGNKNILFIVGCARSGTNLLRNAFDIHPQITVTPELHFFDILIKNRRKQQPWKNKENLEKFAKYIIRKIKKMENFYWDEPDKNIWKRAEVDYTELYKRLKLCNNYKTIFSTLIRFASPQKNAFIKVEKTPANVYYLDKLFELFPDTKIINMIRDGREVLASSSKRWKTKEFIMAARWIEALRSVEKYKTKNPKKAKQILDVKYEDLTSNIKPTIIKVLKFIGINNTPEFFWDKLDSLPHNSSFRDTKKKGVYISKNFIKYFSIQKQKRIEFLLKKFLIKKNYKLLFSGFPKNIIFLKIKLAIERLKLRINFYCRKKGIYYLYNKLK